MIASGGGVDAVMMGRGRAERVDEAMGRCQGAAASLSVVVCFFFQAEDGIRDLTVTGVQTCALPISGGAPARRADRPAARARRGLPPRRRLSRPRGVRLQRRVARRGSVRALPPGARRPPDIGGRRARRRHRLRGCRRARAIGAARRRHGGAGPRGAPPGARRVRHQQPRPRRAGDPRRPPGRSARSRVPALVCGDGRDRRGADSARPRAGRDRRQRGGAARSAADHPHPLQPALDDAVAAWPALRPPDGRLRLIVLDVGQGDAIALEAPDGRVLLVDAGGGGPMRLDAGERVVAPFLWNRGHLRLAGAIVTHPDADHAGGMETVRRLFGAGSTWDADTLARGPLWLGGAMISLVRPLRGTVGGGPGPLGDPWLLGAARPGALETPARGLTASVVDEGPRGHTHRSPRSRNDEAIVLRVEYGLASFLLASDIEAAREQALVASGAPIAATVLKVAHHGSRTSSTPALLGDVGPAVAVISVGPRNPYGHPDPGVLARLATAGARVYRTDRDGAVIFETDGRTLMVTRWAARRTERFCLDPEAIC